MRLMVPVILLVLASLTAADYPRYLECTSSNHCNGYECCAFPSKGRFSIPRCMNRGVQFSRCDSEQNPRGEKRNVTYPDAVQVEFSQVFYLTCPCELGLECDAISSTCVNPIEGDDFNNLQMK